MQRERFLVRAHGDNLGATRAGLVHIIQSIAKDESAVIVVPDFNHLQASMLATALGEDLAKPLIKQRTLSLEDGKKISLCSAKTLKNFKYANLYLALWCSAFVLADIEALRQWRALTLVSWLPAEGDKWAAEKKAVLLVDLVNG